MRLVCYYTMVSSGKKKKKKHSKVFLINMTYQLTGQKLSFHPVVGMQDDPSCVAPGADRGSAAWRRP